MGCPTAAGAAALAALVLLLPTIAAYSPPPRNRSSPNRHRGISIRVPAGRPTPISSSLSASSSSSLPFLGDESLRSVPPRSVLDAVESCPHGLVVASDLSARAGIPLPRARRDLATLAALAGAGMAVTGDGEILYSFPRDLGGELRRSSARYRARAVAERAWPGVFYGIRVGFGAMLIASLLAIFATLAAVSSGAAMGGDEDDEDGRRRGGRGGDFDYGGRPYGGGVNVNLFGPSPFGSIWGPSPFDIFYYRPYYGYYGRRRPPLYGSHAVDSWGGGGPIAEGRDDGLSARRDRLMQRHDEEEEYGEGTRPKLSFLEAIFSYVFGDGDPNRDLDRRLLSAAANVIRENGGAVTAEQLAPFLPVPPSPDSTGRDEWGETDTVDESYVLPIVIKLNGEPTVTDDGDIVYVFPDMIQTAEDDSPRGVDVLSDQDNVLRAARAAEAEIVQEERIGFSLAGEGQRAAAAALGAVNLLGALALGRALAKPGVSGMKLVGLYGLVQQSYPLLLSYAVLYNALPVVRFLHLRRRNKRIRERNSNRRRWAIRLRSAGGSVSRKLAATRGLARQVRRVRDEPIVFDTTEDATNREGRWAREELKEFDDLIGKDN